MTNLVLNLVLARRIELAEAQAAVDAAEALLLSRADSGAAVESLAGGFAVYCGPNSPLTQAVGLGLNGPVSDEDFERLEIFYRGRNEPVRVETMLRSTAYAADHRWLAAALLHDVGKLDSGFSVPGRVVATVAAGAAGRETARQWSARHGFRRRIGLYVEHPRLGADMIRVAGGTEEAAIWAGAHHSPDTWPSLPIPRAVVDALVAADDD